MVFNINHIPTLKAINSATYFPRDTKTFCPHTQKKTYQNLNYNSSNTGNVPDVHKQKIAKKNWHIHKMKHTSAIKRNELYNAQNHINDF